MDYLLLQKLEESCKVAQAEIGEYPSPKCQRVNTKSFEFVMSCVDDEPEFEMQVIPQPITRPQAVEKKK
jgi:hypothetical protein